MQNFSTNMLLTCYSKAEDCLTSRTEVMKPPLFGKEKTCPLGQRVSWKTISYRQVLVWCEPLTSSILVWQIRQESCSDKYTVQKCSLMVLHRRSELEGIQRHLSLLNTIMSIWTVFLLQLWNWALLWNILCHSKETWLLLEEELVKGWKWDIAGNTHSHGIVTYLQNVL